MSPLIGIDGYNLALEEGTGVATYARNLGVSLRALGAKVGGLYGREIGGGDDSLLQEVRFFDTAANVRGGPLRTLRAARGVLMAPSGVDAREIRVSGQVVTEEFAARAPTFDRIWNSNGVFRLALDYFDVFQKFLTVRLPHRPDIMHWTYPLPLRVAGARNIYTVHDLVPLRLPHTTLDNKRRFVRLIKQIAARADHIVTVSEASRQDILSILGVPGDRVTNTYQAVDLPAASLAASDADVERDVKGIWNLEHKGYFLFFGAIEPKKNVDRLIQAYLGSQVNSPLVLVGKRAWMSDKELRLLSVDKRNSRIRHIDYAPLAMLIALIRGAKGVVFPSLYEGFGLPVLEAMTLGTPVITSNTASLPEVAGEAALQVDPRDVRALSNAIVLLDQDPQLRARLAAVGPVQAARFSSLHYQQRLAELYGRLGVDLGGQNRRRETMPAGPRQQALQAT